MNNTQESSRLKSYEEWNKIGRRIHRGSKAAVVQDGVPMFTLDQTYAKNDWLATSIRIAGITGPYDDHPY